MKANLLIAIALFLVSAPAPDAATIAEMTAQFIVLDQPELLQAAETASCHDQTVAETRAAEDLMQSACSGKSRLAAE